MMKECPEILKLGDGKHGTVETWSETLIGQYMQCAIEKKYLIDAIKRREELFK